MGGTVTKDLHIINALAATMRADTAVALARTDGIRWVNLDARVVKSQTETNIVSDYFNPRSFSNNDGTVAWAGDWTESGESDGPTRGDLLVTNSYQLQFKDDRRSLTRSVDLAEATAATLSFDYRRYRLDSSTDYVAVEISANGGSSWSELARFAGPTNDSGLRFASYDITAYATAETAVRFATSSSLGDKDYVYIDNVEIEYTGGGQSEPPDPPDPIITNPNYFLETLNVQPVWDMGYQGQGVTIAVIDSGISHDSDFGDRLLLQEKFNPDANLFYDVYGHGTHVAGLIAGDGTDSNGGYKGIAPLANLISLKVSDENGMAYESDTVAALQWVLDHKDQYNIRVVNISLNSTNQQSYHTSPLDAAAEILWFNEIVVVASAGNRGMDGNLFTIASSPANDPFIITVGSSSESDSSNRFDDVVSIFSSRGTTVDGYDKPDVVAPGTFIYSVLADTSSWADDYPYRVAFGEYIRLSGTSMAAPIVSGAAALLLQAEPGLNPDQVKYRLMNTGSDIVGYLTPKAYPYLDVYDAITTATTGTANTGLEASQLLWTGDDPITWGSVNWGSVNWGSVNWGSVNWGSVNWGSVNWGSVSWDD
jgi:serine protease AprX